MGSWAAARRVVDAHGTDDDNVVLLFADVRMEDEDLYRFLDDAATDLGVEVTRIADGRTPWEVFRDVRMIGNTRMDPCSRILKRELLRRWIEEHYEPKDTVIYLGIDWTEQHRFERAQPRWTPWMLAAPLCDAPYLSKEDILADLQHRGIEPPLLYKLGFPHNNCGGFCIKAGQAHFKLLYEKLPERFMAHANSEAEMREYLGKDVAILRDRRGGTTKPLPLLELKRRIDCGEDGTDPLDVGGCGCAID